MQRKKVKHLAVSAQSNQLLLYHKIYGYPTLCAPFLVPRNTNSNFNVYPS